MEKGFIIIQMGINMLENGRMINLREMASTYSKTVKDMKVVSN